MSALVKLPPQRDLERLPSDDAKYPAEEEKPEIPEAKRGVWVVRACYVRALVTGVSVEPFAGVG